MTDATDSAATSPQRQAPSRAFLSGAFRGYRSWQFALACIVLFGALLRFPGIGFDKPEGAATSLQMQPDERFLSFVAQDTEWPDSIGGYFDTANSPLNPYNAESVNSYVYGTAPLFAVKIIDTTYREIPQWARDALAKVGITPTGGESKYDTSVIWGRRLTSLTDTLTILLVFALGSLLFSRPIGLLGAFLYACAVLPTQLSHFFAMDPYVTFFAMATILASAKMIVANSRRQAALLCLTLGFTVGLGLASKVTAWPLVVIPFAAFSARVALRDIPALDLRWRGGRPTVAGHWSSDISMLCLVMALAIVVFRVAQPYAFQGPTFFDMALNQRWVDDIRREIDFQNGNVDFPPFVQFANRTPFLWPLQNMVLWGMGPALGIASWVATIIAGVLLFKRRELTYLLPLILIVSIFGFQGPRFVAWLRYFVPMYPVMCIFTAWMLVPLIVHARQRTGWFASDTFERQTPWRKVRLPMAPLRVASVAVVFTILLSTVFWAVAFQSIYRAEHPRIEASYWIYENVPRGSAITAELWDDSLPYSVPGHDIGGYRILDTEPFRPDSREKVNELIYGSTTGGTNGGLVAADFVVVSSHRVKGAIKQLPGEYPATILYYESLDNGALGFDLVAHFESRPNLFGITIDDSGADESFTVYDHPEVSIYKKSERWDPTAALTLLLSAEPERAQNLLPRQGRTNGLQFTDGEAAIQQAGGTFRDVFYGGLGGNVPWLWWFLWLELAAIAAVPWMTWLFRWLPDRGYGLTKIVGFAGIGLVTWLLVAWNVVHFSGTLAWVVFAAWIAAGMAVGWFRRAALAGEVREKWRLWASAEAVFAVAFIAFLMLRAFNPDVWHHPQGGEKPMELAYMTAVVKSTILPPFDPWFGGGTMNYYYMGWFLLAVPIRAIRIVPEIAFNLAIPTYAAIGAATAFSTVANLVGISQRTRRAASGSTARIPVRAMVITGIVGGILLIGIGNLDGAHQTIERFQHLNVATLDAAGQPDTYHWGFASDVPFVGGLVGFLSGLKQFLFDGGDLRGFDWWRSSRAHIGQFDITEFPFWSLLFADLHPHLMGLPFLGLLIAFGLAYVRTAMAGDRTRAWIFAGMLGIALGFIRTIHTWDFPTAVLLVGSSILVGQLLAPGRWQTRWWMIVGHLVLAAGLLTVLFQPYTQHFEVFNSGIMKTPETTKANQYFAHFGLFVVAMVAFLAVRYREVLEERGFNAGRNPVLAVVAGRWETMALGVFLFGLTAFTWKFGLTSIALSVVALCFLFNLLWLEWMSDERDLGRIFATAFFCVAVGVAAGTDVVVVKNDIVRMNTVFKFLLQSWQLYALASAYAAWYVGSALWSWDGWRARAVPGRKFFAVTATLVAGVFMFSAAIYLWSGTAARQNARFVSTGPTLDGFAYFPGSGLFDDNETPDPVDDVEVKLADDKPLIDWLRLNVDGSPVIAEAVGGLYHWTGRFSWNTGLPSVIGWDWHQTQQRWDYSSQIQQRRLDTKRFFDDNDAGFAYDYIDRYRVKYIVIGTEEHIHGTVAGIEKFASMDGVTEVFRSGRYAIYRVD